ncbi:MAG: hypothetical protein AMXMBFR7_04910 [Planctomycetota bacterium]
MRASKIMGPLVGATFGGFGLAVLIGFVAKMDVLVTAPGEVRPRRYAELRPIVEGRVIELYKGEGDWVKAGEPILKIDSSKDEYARQKLRSQLNELESKLADCERVRKELLAKLELARVSVKEAEADILSRRAKVAECEQALKQAKAAPEALEILICKEKLKQKEIAERDAKKYLEGCRELLEKGVLSEHNYNKASSEYETSRSASEVARNELDLLAKQRNVSESEVTVAFEKAQAQLESAQAELAAAQARSEKRLHEVALAELALEDKREAEHLKSEIEKLQLEDRNLVQTISEKVMCAPIAGLIHDFHVKIGQTVTHKELAGWVYDTTGFLFYAYAKQVDMPDLAKDEPALLYLDALPYRKEGTFEATVVEVGQVAQPPSAEYGPYSGSLKILESDPTPRTLVILEVKQGDPRVEKLRVGFPGYAEIVVGRASIIEILFDMHETGGRAKRPAPQEAAQAAP